MCIQPSASTPSALERGSSAIEWYMDYFRRLIAERRAWPQSDLVSALIAVLQAGEGLGKRELLANVIFLLSPGMKGPWA